MNASAYTYHSLPGASQSSTTKTLREVELSWGTDVDVTDPNMPRARYVIQLIRDTDDNHFQADVHLLRMLDGELRAGSAVWPVSGTSADQMKSAAKTHLKVICENASFISLRTLETLQTVTGNQPTQSTHSNPTATATKISVAQLNDQATKIFMSLLETNHRQRAVWCQGGSADLYGTVFLRTGLADKVAMIIMGSLTQEQPVQLFYTT